MKAVLFETIGEPLRLSELPDPSPQPGEVVLNVVAAPVLAYAHEVFSGARPMLFELPFVPGTGAIGRVQSLGAGATALRVGDWVYCDPTLRARDGEGLPAIALQGLTANGPAALPVQRQFPNGSWAERLCLPIENTIPIGAIAGDEAARWLALGTLLVPYGGLDSVGLSAGETVVVNGATGSFGSASVAVALAMGAARVVATGRNRSALDGLADRFGPRVRTVALDGEGGDGTQAIQDASGRPIDVVFDILPPAANVAQVISAAKAVRPGGRISLMGGVGMTGGGDLALPYPWLMRNNITVRGQRMYPRSAIPVLVSMIRAGQLDLSHYRITEFALQDFVQAVGHAADNAGPFDKTVLRVAR